MWMQYGYNLVEMILVGCNVVAMGCDVVVMSLLGYNVVARLL